MTIIALSVLIFGWAFFSIFRIITTRAPDFSVLWFIAKDFYKTPNPYLNPNIFTPSGYPPFTYLLYIPLTPLSLIGAQLIFTLLSFAAILGSVYLSLKIVFKKVNLYILLFASSLTLTSFPVKFTLGMGQINAIVLFLLLLSFYLHLKNKSVTAGIIVGIAIILKPIFGFFLLFYILRKDWKLISYSLVTVFIGFLASLIYYGPALWFYWLKDIVTPLANLAGRESYYNQGLLGFVSRLTTSVSIRKVTELGSMFLLIPVIFYQIKRRNVLLTLSVSIISLLLVDSLSWQHHFVWLIFPFVVLTGFAIKFKKLWYWILLGLSYLLVSWNFKNPAPFLDFPKSLLLSNTFYGAVILYILNLYSLAKAKKT